MSDEQMDAWVKDVLGIDLSARAGQAAGVATRQQNGSGTPSAGAVAGSGAGTAAVAGGVGAKAAGAATGAAVGAMVGAVNSKVIAAAEGVYAASMKRLDAAIKGVKDAGLETSPYDAQAKNIREAHDDALKQADLGVRAKAVTACSTRAKAAADEAVADVVRLKKSAVEGVTAAIKSMRDEAKAQIDTIAKTDPQKAGLEKELGTLDASIEAAGKETDRAARAKSLKAVNTAAQTLFDKAVKVTHDDAKVQAVYAKALKERYGIQIKNPDKMPNTHLDQVYKMFDRVPEADVAQNKLKQLEYEPFAFEDDGHGKLKKIKNDGASYGGASINMGDYAEEDWPYVDPKDPTGQTPMPANGFSISTLHELGHSVDDRFKIMDNNQGKTGGGGWRKESLGSVAKMFVAEFKAGDGKKLSKPLADKALTAAVNGALGGTVTRPAGMTDPDWGILKTTLDVCFTRRAGTAAWPWGDGNTHDIGGRTYHEAYSNQWYSYETAVRGKAVTVRDYQWRAPGEWFAELYAFSFYNKKKPPTAVDAALADYMFGGSAADKGAPAAKGA